MITENQYAIPYRGYPMDEERIRFEARIQAEEMGMRDKLVEPEEKKFPKYPSMPNVHFFKTMKEVGAFLDYSFPP